MIFDRDAAFEGHSAISLAQTRCLVGRDLQTAQGSCWQPGVVGSRSACCFGSQMSVGPEFMETGAVRQA